MVKTVISGFDDVEEELKKLGDFFNVEEGKNETVHFPNEEIKLYYNHWYKKRGYRCLDVTEKDCPFCKAGLQRSRRFYINAYVHESNEHPATVQIMELSQTAFRDGIRKQRNIYGKEKWLEWDYIIHGDKRTTNQGKTYVFPEISPLDKNPDWKLPKGMKLYDIELAIRVPSKEDAEEVLVEEGK